MNKNQLGVWGIAVKSSGGVRGGATEALAFSAYIYCSLKMKAFTL